MYANYCWASYVKGNSIKIAFKLITFPLRSALNILGMTLNTLDIDIPGNTAYVFYMIII